MWAACGPSPTPTARVSKISAAITRPTHSLQHVAGSCYPSASKSSSWEVWGRGQGAILWREKARGAVRGLRGGIRTSGPHTKLSLKDKSLRSSTVGDKRSVVSRPARNPSVSEHYCGALEDSWRRGDVDEASILPASILKDNN